MAMMAPLLVALLAAQGGPDAEAQTMKYFVAGRQKEPLDKEQQKAREKELKEKRSAAEKTASSVGKSLESQHGKNRDAWPEAAKKELEAAARASASASLEYEMLSVEQKDIDSSAADLKRSFQTLAEKDPKRQIQVAGSKEDASVAVDVVARVNHARAAVLYLKITPVQWLAPAQLAALSMQRGAEGSGYESAMIVEKGYDAQSPYWIVSVWEFIMGGGRWGGVANTAAELLAEVAVGHKDFFRHGDPKTPKK